MILSTCRVDGLGDDHPLRGLANCILLPHFGYATREIYDVFYRQTAEAVTSYLDRTARGREVQV